ncbi:MAG: hypothetical protein GEV06_26965 [Luteitalea sp.]|nr:hypothetical protein [Luteitalea sp.]
MAHPLILALFDVPEAAVDAARAMRALGVPADRLSVVARTHDDEGDIAARAGGTPGAEIEDSRPAGWLGELGAQLVALVALVLPGIGPIVSAGPLAAEAGETAGHLAGGLHRVLARAGVEEALIDRWQARVRAGAVLLGVHTSDANVPAVQQTLIAHGSSDLALAQWDGD